MSAGLTRPTTRRSWYRYVFEHQSASGFGLVLVIVMGALGYAQVVPNGPLVVVVAMVISYEFQKRLDQGVPLLQLTCLLAVLQWLVGPLLNYSFDFEYFYGRYSMYVDENTYFRFAVPATCAYVAVMLLAGISVRQKNIFQNVNNRSFLEFGIILNLIGLGAAFAAGRVGGSLQFLLHLLSQLRYVGALYFLFSRSQFRIPLALVSCAPLVSRSLGSGMFHDLILWSAILFCFWFAQRRWQVTVKLIVLSLVGVVLFSVQVVKQDYRRQIREGKDPALVPLIVEYMKPGGKAWSDDALMLVVTRLNQGWIISAVMNHVPESEPYANGETVNDAIAAALMPRLIFKDKKTAGGRDNFRKYTGLDIQDGTSMGISPLGEAYANFGVEIGILFMVLFGAVFAVIYRVTLRYALKYPTFLFWIPLIFYQAIKAETELLVVLNQLTKGAVIAFGGHYLLNSMLPQRRSGIPNISARRASVPPS